MNETQEILHKLISLMGFEDFSINFSQDSHRFSVFINDAPFLQRYLAHMVNDLDFVLKGIVRKKGLGPVFVDINNYRKEREDLIIKLAKAGARKAATAREKVILPPMNAYERRIVHTELAVHPDLKTESQGEGKERRVVIKPIEE
ncbi:MAG: R3H domain protein [Candidatus Wolfebacteria bacterium GW2011_GWC1_43_10]|uniref:R3H domain protein n=2 Tax=Candidatus Wolfeibacteriota TaxID=1752735 RepID=A0A0G1CAT5_9BACT|nr:MAG: R3H domain protein [Candidatus Wolfebacteria bacterium GW2011_GWC1_43_10]KKT23134.1 MAG: R3H domain protein [Parcubacteria group bacterium GW2011_GWB1_43_8b]